jgi:hypothetical protein
MWDAFSGFAHASLRALCLTSLYFYTKFGCFSLFVINIYVFAGTVFSLASATSFSPTNVKRSRFEIATTVVASSKLSNFYTVNFNTLI